MLFTPKITIMSSILYFPQLKIGDSCLQYVSKFKYFCHIIVNSFTDDKDSSEKYTVAMFVRCNILARKFSRCSVNVKLTFFRAFCLAYVSVTLLYGVRST